MNRKVVVMVLGDGGRMVSITHTNHDRDHDHSDKLPLHLGTPAFDKIAARLITSKPFNMHEFSEICLR